MAQAFLLIPHPNACPCCSPRGIPPLHTTLQTWFVEAIASQPIGPTAQLSRKLAPPRVVCYRPTSRSFLSAKGFNHVAIARVSPKIAKSAGTRRYRSWPTRGGRRVHQLALPQDDGSTTGGRLRETPPLANDGFTTSAVGK